MITPSPEQLVKGFLKGFTCSAEAVSKASPLAVPQDCNQHSSLAIQTLYLPDEAINIVTEFAEETGGNRITKANPNGCGQIKKREEWLAQIQLQGTPQLDGGAWLRMNPLDGRGIRDANVTAFRYFLLESDSLSQELQISLLAKLRLPIAMILSSGGRSYHSWVKINAKDEAAYQSTVAAIFAWLNPYGWDGSNKNPSRLSRLPGATRRIGASGDGIQRLIYLNPNPSGAAIL